MNNVIRHGEIMLVPIKDIPKGVRNEHTHYIVGHSETGHHHVLESKAGFEVFLDEATKALYLDVSEPAELVHKKTLDKHRTLPVAPGKYEVHIKTEYDPWNQVLTNVFD